MQDAIFRYYILCRFFPAANRAIAYYSNLSSGQSLAFDMHERIAVEIHIKMI